MQRLTANTFETASSMLSRHHSRTAEVTAAIRAAHLHDDEPRLFEDPFALRLTSPMWRLICGNRLLHRLVVRGLLGALRPIHGWILVRDRFSEDCLRTYAEKGGRQFVLLGAGFDSTALRRPSWLERVSIFEVDHPATQAVKLARLSRLGGPEAGAGFVPVAVDFERERVVDGLSRVPFERQARTLFAWQGVVYYLSSDAIEETLRDVAELAAPGSELIFDFLLPQRVLPGNSGRVQSFARLFTSRLGEQYVSYHTHDEIRALAQRHGFDIVDIHGDRDLERTYLQPRADGLSVMRGFGIAHLRKA